MIVRSNNKACYQRKDDSKHTTSICTITKRMKVRSTTNVATTKRMMVRPKLKDRRRQNDDCKITIDKYFPSPKGWWTSPKGWWLHDNDKHFHHQKHDGNIINKACYHQKDNTKTITSVMTIPKNMKLRSTTTLSITKRIIVRP